MTHETLMSKNVKIFQGPTDRRTDRPTDGPTDRPTEMTSPRSSSPELKNLEKLYLLEVLGYYWRYLDIQSKNFGPHISDDFVLFSGAILVLGFAQPWIFFVIFGA